MKQILFILLAAISFSSQAQKKDCLLCGTDYYSISTVSLQNEFYATLKKGSDTLEITISKGVHFIKIDDDVYEITRKTELKKVEPVFNPYSNSVLYSDPAFQFDNNIPSDTTNLYFDASPLKGMGNLTDSNHNTYQFNPKTLTWEGVYKEQPKKKGKKK